ncbi:MAG: orotate phosphoribosyltransferase [Methylococcaceae bacterium]|nr:orotate phosphoribosyltransferase [Methylococcaceae bacterium]
MHTYQEDFIRYAIKCDVLRFGDFTLKSGRRSPYFFNTGRFDTGARLDRLGQYYAEALLAAGIQADVLFGPAYKGIPLACATAIALSRKTGQEIPFAFNRKETKEHGEGGRLVGSPLRGNVLILDDVITAGTSVRESVEIIRAAGAKPCGVLIALDRQERGEGERSAVEEVAALFTVPVHSIISLTDIIEYLEASGHQAGLAAIRKYQA